MALFHISYRPFPIPPSDPFPGGQTAHRPLLILRVIASETGKHLSCIGCVDTGADHCIFPLSFASVLGLDPLTLKKQMTGGVGSTANVTYYAEVDVQIPMSPGVTLTFSTLAGFTDGLEAQGIGLLGQSGFFETFRVLFDLKAKVFTIDDGKP